MLLNRKVEFFVPECNLQEWRQKENHLFDFTFYLTMPKNAGKKTSILEYACIKDGSMFSVKKNILKKLIKK